MGLGAGDEGVLTADGPAKVGASRGGRRIIVTRPPRAQHGRTDRQDGRRDPRTR